ncbi:MAG: hypothetical protein ACRYG7_43630 [Janthinobacterium lividum]
MQASRSFNVVLVKPGNGVNVAPATKAAKAVAYTGKAVTVTL